MGGMNSDNPVLQHEGKFLLNSLDSSIIQWVKLLIFEKFAALFLRISILVPLNGTSPPPPQRVRRQQPEIQILVVFVDVPARFCARIQSA
jgi:hypothetical protein